jgi:asparagine synthetase B (glutamine-hydrolysing)
MRAYVAVVAKRPGRVDEEDVLAAARRSLPFRTDGIPEASWSDDSGRVLLAGWSNEPPQVDRPLLTTTETGAVGFSGYRHGPVPGAADLEHGPAPRAGGVWSLVGASRGGITALTCASGAETVFYAENADVAVIGNRALLVHLVAHPGGPVPDLTGLAGVLNSGYCVTTRTAFAGVRALTAGARVRVDANGSLVVEPYPVDTGAASAADVAEALLASVAPLRSVDRPVRLGLTGGRDSRLIVALLTSAQVPVTTYTAGSAEDPDVIVAQEVAARLGVDSHKITPPRGAAVVDGTVTFDVRSRLREAVVLGEGMLSAYDRVGRIDDSYDAQLVPFGGGGGEILRGYYAGASKDLDDDGAATRYLRRRLFAAAKQMASRGRADYEADTAPWMDAARQRGAHALEDFYVRQRAGRWTGAARSSASIGSLALRPFLDHIVVGAVRRVPLEDRTSERLIADLLDVLAPELKDVRFAGRRWKFDEVPPSDPAARTAWKERAPVQGRHGDEAGFSWRTDLTEVRQELADVIRSAPPVFWELADQKKVSEFLSPLDGRSRADTVKMWHLATVADALAQDFYAGEAKFDGARSDAVAVLPAKRVERPTVALQTSLRRLARRARNWTKS